MSDFPRAHVAWGPDEAQKAARAQGMCGELLDGGKQICILAPGDGHDHVRLSSVATPGGGYDIVSTRYEPAIVLVRVRPVGTLEWGDLPMFVPDWVDELKEALDMAVKLSDDMPHRRKR